MAGIGQRILMIGAPAENHFHREFLKGRTIGFSTLLQEQNDGVLVTNLMPRQIGRQSAMEALREMEMRHAVKVGRQMGMTELSQEYAAMQAAAAYAPAVNREQRRAAEKKGRRVTRKD